MTEQTPLTRDQKLALIDTDTDAFTLEELAIHHRKMRDIFRNGVDSEDWEVIRRADEVIYSLAPEIADKLADSLMHSKPAPIAPVEPIRYSVERVTSVKAGFGWYTLNTLFSIHDSLEAAKVAALELANSRLFSFDPPNVQELEWDTLTLDPGAITVHQAQIFEHPRIEITEFTQNQSMVARINQAVQKQRESK